MKMKQDLESNLVPTSFFGPQRGSYNHRELCSRDQVRLYTVPRFHHHCIADSPPLHPLALIITRHVDRPNYQLTVSNFLLKHSIVHNGFDHYCTEVI